ncbi:MAG TPA: YheC/YheD family protein [Bacillales bacterium]
MNQPLKLRKTEQTTGIVELPGFYRQQMTGNISWLAFSTRRTPCRVVFSDFGEDAHISEDLWEALHLPHEENIHLFCRENTLHIGPLIGIFTAGFTDYKLRPIGERTQLFAKFLSVADQVGAFCFVFGRHHINWEEGTVNGFFYQEEGWQQITVPFPDVIYDRLPNRRTERLTRFQSAKQQLQDDYLIPWFNPGFFDKWHMHQLLQTDDRSLPYLPETTSNPSLETLKGMLETHNHIYLKPTEGSLGLGIHQIIKHKDRKSYYCRFHDGNQTRLRRFDTLEALIHQQLPDDRLKYLLAQEGIKLMQWQNRPVDFRVHTNKNENGEWVVSTVAAKAAGHGSVTTHIKYGGQVKTIEEILGQGLRKETALNKLKEAALTISSVIEEKVEGTVGEIGFDLGLDQHGRVWLFEANAKPGRHIFVHPKLKDADEQSRKLPLAFAVYLARNAIIQPAVLYA